jgi:hypothetical protein
VGRASEHHPLWAPLRGKRYRRISAIGLGFVHERYLRTHANTPCNTRTQHTHAAYARTRTPDTTCKTCRHAEACISAADYMVHVVGCMLQVGSYTLSGVAQCMVWVLCCQSLIACCVLSVARCTWSLSIARCRLHVVRGALRVLQRLRLHAATCATRAAAPDAGAPALQWHSQVSD